MTLHVRLARLEKRLAPRQALVPVCQQHGESPEAACSRHGVDPEAPGVQLVYRRHYGSQQVCVCGQRQQTTAPGDVFEPMAWHNIRR